MRGAIHHLDLTVKEPWVSRAFYDAVLEVGTGPIRTAIRANLVFIRPLSRGDHVIEADVHFAEGGGDFSATYLIHVRGTDDDD